MYCTRRVVLLDNGGMFVKVDGTLGLHQNLSIYCTCALFLGIGSWNLGWYFCTCRMGSVYQLAIF